MLDLKFYFCVLRPSSKRMHRNIIGVQGKNLCGALQGSLVQTSYSFPSLWDHRYLLKHTHTHPHWQQNLDQPTNHTKNPNHTTPKLTWYYMVSVHCTLFCYRMGGKRRGQEINLV